MLLTTALALGAIVLLTACMTAWWVRNKKRANSEPPRAVPCRVPEYSPLEITFGLEPSMPVLAIRELLSFDPGSAEPIKGTEVGLHRLAPLLQALPHAAVAAEVHAGRYMEVVVDGALARSTKGDYYLPFVRGDKGRVAEQAKLLDPDRLGKLVNAAAVYNLVSIIVAQQHLARIDTRLAELQEGVEELLWRDSERQKSMVTTALKNLRIYSASLGQGEREPAVRVQIESLENQLGTINDLLLKDIEKRFVEALGTEAASKWNLWGKYWKGDADYVSQARDDRYQVQDRANQWLQCMFVRTVALQLTAMFSESRVLVSERLADIRSETQRFKATVGDGADRMVKHVEMQLSREHGDRVDLASRSSFDSLTGKPTLQALESASVAVESLLVAQDGKVTLAIEVGSKSGEPRAFRLADR